MAFDFPNPPLTVGQTFSPSGGPTYTWNGTAWVLPVPSGGGGGASVTIADSAPSQTQGALWWQSNTGTFWISYNDGSSTQWVALNGPGTNPAVAPVPASLSGLVMTWNTAALVTVAPGGACSDDNTTQMVLGSAWQKGLSGPWALGGTGQAGLDTGTVAASTWYHIFLIVNPSTGSVDWLYSTNVTSPIMPSGFTKKRRIGSILTDGSNNILSFTQVSDEFILAAPVISFTGTAPAGTSLYAVTTPLGVKTDAILTAVITPVGGTQTLVLFSPDQTTSSSVPMWAASGTASGTSARIRTNTASQINGNSNIVAAGTNITTWGWVDYRGK